MAISVDERAPILLQKLPKAKDSLKLVDIQKTFSIIEEVPAIDAIAQDNGPAYNEQINDILHTMKALQIAKKSLRDVQSVTKDIKSNYKTEKNDAWAPIDDTMLRQRYDATQQIKNILKNAVLNHKNVFTLDYAKDGVTLDLQRKDINMLNLRDEHSINIFYDNIERLSQQIEENIQKLQGKIDKINQDRWLSMENLRNVRLEQKEVNAGLKNANQTPSLASALAQIAQQQNTQETPAQIKQDIMASEMKAAESPKQNITDSMATSTTQQTNTDNGNKTTQTQEANKAAQDSNATLATKEDILNTAKDSTTQEKPASTTKTQDSNANKTQVAQATQTDTAPTSNQSDNTKKVEQQNKIVSKDTASQSTQKAESENAEQTIDLFV